MKALLIILVFLSFNTLNAQNNRDLSYIYNSYNLNRINLDYRQSINEKYKYKIGLVIGQGASSPFEKGDIVFGSDSLITYRYNVYNTTQFSLKIGGERVLGNSIFSIGADVLLSYRNEKNYIYYSDYIYDDSLKIWKDNTAYNPSGMGFDNPNNSKVKRGYFVPQLQLSFLMDLPIVDRLYLNLFVGGVFAFPILVNESKKYDPLNELILPTTLTTFEMSSLAGMGLRFTF